MAPGDRSDQSQGGGGETHRSGVLGQGREEAGPTSQGLSACRELGFYLGLPALPHQHLPEPGPPGQDGSLPSCPLPAPGSALLST